MIDTRRSTPTPAMAEAQLRKILPQLPSAISSLYCSLRRLQCSHEEAYRRTFKLASQLGWTASEAGLPAHEGRKRLLLQSELMRGEFLPRV